MRIIDNKLTINTTSYSGKF